MSCSALPDDHFTYLFSFGCFCHLSFEGISAYMRNLWPKLRVGAECFLMVSDYDKANQALERAAAILVSKAVPQGKRGNLVRRAWRLSQHDRLPWGRLRDEDLVPRPGRWYDAGVGRMTELLEQIGDQVLDPDMGLTHRDPVMHFRRPRGR